MAKPSKSESLADWRKAETRYREVIDPYLAKDTKKVIDKKAALEIAQARAKAGKRLDLLLHRLLD
jgi:hypothetical protein